MAMDKTNMTAEKDAREKVMTMIKDIKVAQMVTQDADGRLYARPMWAQQKEQEESLWFFTEIDSPKINEIRYNPNIVLSYSDPDNQNYVSLSGRAAVVTDQAEIDKRWNESLRTWFPKGRDDDQVALIRFDAESAEYWDAPSSKLVHAYGYVKAVVTGEKPDAGDNKKVRMA